MVWDHRVGKPRAAPRLAQDSARDSRMGRSPGRTSPQWLSLLIEAFGEMGFRVLAQVGALSLGLLPSFSKRQLPRISKVAIPHSPPALSLPLIPRPEMPP